MQQLRTDPPTEEMLRNSPENDETSQCLTDGENNLWAFGEEEITLGRFGGNVVEDILDALERHYSVTIVDEFDERFHAEC
jgi:hypothetical protein